MKKLSILAIAAIALLAGCGTPSPRTVEYPLIGQVSTNTIDISRVELADSATILTVDARYQPHSWIRISPQTTLHSGGKSYALVSGEGIVPGEEFWMPDSGEASFRLIFEPLPLGAKSFDFVEGNSQGDFLLLDVDLTGKTEYRVSSKIPASVRRLKRQTDKGIPEPVLAIGTTTINVHLYGRDELMPDEIEYTDSYLHKLIKVKVDPKTHTSRIELEQYGSGEIYMRGICSIFAAPGETVDVHYDMQYSGMEHERYFRGENLHKHCRHIFVSGGRYASLNMPEQEELLEQDMDKYYIQAHRANFCDWRTTGDEYVALLKSEYESKSAALAASSLSNQNKHILQTLMQSSVMDAMVNHDNILGMNYMVVNGRGWEDIDEARIEPLEKRHFAEVATWFDISNPAIATINGMGYREIAAYDWKSVCPELKGLLADLYTLGNLPEKAEAGTLTDKDLAIVDGLDNPFYGEALRKIDAKAKQALAKTGELIEMVPDVDADKVFDAIVGRYKGKVILVDFWNSWCIPCREAISRNEPLKTGELQSDKLEWVYIANHTSPIEDYNELIPNIKGHHYRVDKEQWGAMCDKFGINSIPSYVLVLPDGSYSLRNDLRDHDKLKNELKQLISE